MSYTVNGCDCCAETCVVTGCGCRNTTSTASVSTVVQVETTLSPSDGGSCFECGGDPVAGSERTITFAGGTGAWNGAGGWTYKGTVDVQDESGASVSGYPVADADISVSGGCGSWTIAGGGQAATFGAKNSEHSGTTGGESMACVAGPDPDTCKSVKTTGSISVSPDDCCLVPDGAGGGACYHRKGRKQDGRCPACCSCCGCWLETTQLKLTWAFTDDSPAGTAHPFPFGDEAGWANGDLTLDLESQCLTDTGYPCFGNPDQPGGPTINNPVWTNATSLPLCPNGTHNGSDYEAQHYQGLTARVTYNCTFTPWPGLWSIRVWNLDDCERDYGIDVVEDDAPGFFADLFADGYGASDSGTGLTVPTQSDPNYQDELLGNLCGADADIVGWKVQSQQGPGYARWKGHVKIELSDKSCCKQSDDGPCLQDLGDEDCDTGRCPDESPAP